MLHKPSAKKIILRKALLWATLLLVAWLMAPRLAVWSIRLATKKGEASSKAAQDRIVFVGERSIPHIISSIEKNSPWVRRYGYLPGALQRIGGSAKPQLLAAISSQQDPKKKLYLIHTLQSAFHDFSHLPFLWDSSVSPKDTALALTFMEHQIREQFPAAPELKSQESQQINPEFIKYWSSTHP